MFATLDRGRIHPEVAEQRSSGETSKIISDAASVLVAWAQDLSYRISDDFLLLDCAETFRDTRYSTLPWARRYDCTLYHGKHHGLTVFL